MFKEEKYIDGVLCWRSTPDGDFVPYTVAELSFRLEIAERDLSKVIVQLGSILRLL
jgi:hypothetical protein